jgi:hypothetical protein
MSYIGNEPIVSATRTVTEVTATAGQTVFNANGGYTVGYLDVFLNGAQLQNTDFTATNGSTVTLSSAASIGDDIRLVAWGIFSNANHYTKAESDSLLDDKLSTTGTAAAASKLTSTNWTVEETSGVLYFKYGGVNKAKLDSSGNLTVTGNVTAYGTV